jgi:tetraacyldisaccharide 4'-kinase
MSLCAVAEAIYRRLYERRRQHYSAGRQVDWPCKIISVGNLTLGGTGKTPAVQWLARWLQAESYRVAIVARGYGGSLSAPGAVVADGDKILMRAREAGDEPLLHARNLPGVAVVIGRDRETAVRTAIHDCGAEVVVLDDAYQYWSLHRDCDLLLLDTRRPFDNGHLLPCGRLREPPAALSRADAVLLTRVDVATEAERQNAHVAIGQFTQAPIFEASHVPLSMRHENGGQTHPLEELRGLPVAALSAIANNAGFAITLERCGARVVAQLQRRDHYHWRARELQNFATEAVRHGARAIVTTEKDAVKIDPAWLANLPLWSLAVGLSLSDKDAAALRHLVATKLQLKTHY